MVTFWNITSNKLNSLEIAQNEEKIIFVSDTERLFVDYKGTRTEYRNIIYVQDINNLSPTDENKNSIYFEISTKKLYYYANGSFVILNPDPESFTYIGRFLENVEITQNILNTFVQLVKGRPSQINDLVIDINKNQWLKVEEGTDEDWINLSEKTLASYESFGLVKIKKNSGLKIENGILSLNLLDSDRLPGQIVTLNNERKN